MRFRFIGIALPGLVLVLLAPGVAAAGGGGGGGPCSGFTRGPAVSMLDFCFQGAAHFVDPGTTVEVTNDGEAPHDFTAVDGSFASGIMEPGDRFELTVDDPGVVRYYCTLHGTADGNGMTGVLVVGDSGAILPASASTDREARPTDAAMAGGTSPISQDTTAPLMLAVAALVLAAVALTVGLGTRTGRFRSSQS